MCKRTFLFCKALTVNFIAGSELACTQVDNHNSDEDNIEQDDDERDADENYDDSIELSDGLKEKHDGHLATIRRTAFMDNLLLGQCIYSMQ